MIWGFRAPTGAPRFEVAFVHRLRIAVAATILRAWQRDGFAFVTLTQAWFGRAEVVRGVARKPGTLVARPVKACSRRGCAEARLAVAHGSGVLCAEHEGAAVGALGGGGAADLVFIERATWPVDSEARIRELRAQLEGVEAARAEVV